MLILRAVIIAGVLSPGLLAGFCVQEAPRPAEPSLVLHETFWSGLVVDPKDERTGTLIALWDDGTVVFAKDARQPGKDLQAGHITAAQLKQVLDELNGAGFFGDLPGSGTAPDASYWIIDATRDGKRSHYECMWADPDRYWGANVDATEQTRRFAKMWTLSRTIIAFARPTKSVPLQQDQAAARAFSLGAGPGKLQKR